MASWWRLRTQAYLVLSVLLFLIAFLGAYALSEAKRHAVEADELLGANFKAASILKEIEASHVEEMRTAAKYAVTRDAAYYSMSIQQRAKVIELLQQLQSMESGDILLSPLVTELLRRHQRTSRSFLQGLREFEKRLEVQRSEKVERVRLVARDLGKIIFVAFLIAIGVTSWLGVILYHAVLRPIESIKRAACRIREGELSYRVEEFHGVAELYELRREFNAMATKLEELDRMKGDFLSTVSHELRTPLTALKEGLNFLGEKQATLAPHVLTRTLEVCSQATKRLETMIQNLLNHAKMESGFYSFDERPKNFVGVLELAFQGVKPIAERRGMTLELRLQSPQLLASFSSEGMTHAIENLLLNAIKYGDAEHPILVEVSKVEALPVPQLEVKVTNHGKGLLPAELTQVFEKFFRGSNADGQKGVGLGLSVVKRIVEAHHGTVAVESSNGITVFSFRIPQRYESGPLVQASVPLASSMVEVVS